MKNIIDYIDEKLIQKGYVIIQKNQKGIILMLFSNDICFLYDNLQKYERKYKNLHIVPFYDTKDFSKKFILFLGNLIEIK